MKYDIYKGTVNDIEESGGELILAKCDKSQVEEFCKKQFIHGINNTADFLNGDYIAVGEYGFWLEEAM